MKTKITTIFSIILINLAVSTAMAQKTEPDPRIRQLVEAVQTLFDVVTTEPEEGRFHVLHFDASALPEGFPDKLGPLSVGKMRVFFIRGTKGMFRLELSGDVTGHAVFGCWEERPWLQSPSGKTFIGEKTFRDAGFDSPLHLVRSDVAGQIPKLRSMIRALAVSADALPVKPTENDWRLAEGVKTAFKRVERNVDEKAVLRIVLEDKIDDFAFGPKSTSGQEVPTEDLVRQFSASVNFAFDRLLPRNPPFYPPQKVRRNADKMTVSAKASNGKGLLAEQFGRRVLFMEGTPEEMGTVQGELVAESAKRTVERTLYGVGTVTTLKTNGWFFDELAEIERRATPHIPERFLREIDALAAASGISKRDARFANFFPERFHCSGVAVRGKASKDGRVYHARVLDYMSDILLQEEACLQVFMPKDHYRWVSQGYGGFVGTVTAINEKGLAMGEMGGRGEGAWDGLPMSFLMREVMETASNVDEALAVIRKNKLTCEYYYVLSDKSRNMVGLKCTPEEVLVLKPGEQHELLPPVPEDTVFMSAGNRAVELGKRLHEHFGKIDAELLIEIVKRPVAMRSNLHNAIFVPEDGEIRVAEAGLGLTITPACDMPYSTFRLEDLFRFYNENRN